MIEETLQRLLEHLENRYHGKYRGYVYANEDDQKLGRIRAKVPRLFGDTPTGWCMPSAPYAGPDQGFFTVPDVGTGVWIEFEEGDLARPIWSGMFWGRPTQEEIEPEGRPPARHPRGDSEVPQHLLQRPPEGPGEVATAGVRILKSSTGHHIVMDDRKGHERLEIQDAYGNRLIFDVNGISRIASNERTLDKGNRSAKIRGDETLDVNGDQTVEVGGQQTVTVGKDVEHAYGADFKETVTANKYERRVDKEGVTETSSGQLYEHHGGRMFAESGGAMEMVAGKGFALSSSRGLSMQSLLGIDIATTFPAVPSPNAISLNAFIGNISINTKIGILQLGGLTAISPMVCGDGVMIQNTMLAGISLGFNPLAAMGYGPAMASWAAATLPMSLSLFGFVKRFPVG